MSTTLKMNVEVSVEVTDGQTWPDDTPVSKLHEWADRRAEELCNQMQTHLSRMQVQARFRGHKVNSIMVNRQ